MSSLSSSAGFWNTGASSFYSRANLAWCNSSSSAWIFFLCSNTFFMVNFSSLSCSSNSSSMYIRMSWNRGITMYSKALTLLEVTWMTLSSLIKEVWREAISTTISRSSLKMFLVFSIYTDPLVKEIFSNVKESSSLAIKIGSLTPAILFTERSNVKLGLFT